MNQYKIYRFLAICLFITHLAGIGLNAALALVALMLAIGIPGFVAFFFCGKWSFRPEAMNTSFYLKAGSLILAYNIFIYYVLESMQGFGNTELFFNFYPSVFVMLNCFFSLLLIIAAIIHPFRNPRWTEYPYRHIEYPPMSEASKAVLSFFLGFCVFLVILCVIFFFIFSSFNPAG